ncbi:MAG: alpha/beta fold hydrolase [Mycobacteriales bacterium]
MRSSCREIAAADGRTLTVYDTGRTGAGDAVLVWHHGTPQTGEPPAPIVPVLGRFGLRCISYDRPGYRGSAFHRDRNVASAAADVAAIADALGIEEFATVGISSGGPHALACAALLPGRVTAAVTVAGPAPIGADGLDWFAGMATAVEARMRAGRRGRVAIEAHLSSQGFRTDGLTRSDLTALVGDWQWLSASSQEALSAGFPGVVDDVLCMVTPWGFRPATIDAPVLVVHGTKDRIVPSTHGEWLARHLGAAELWLRPGDGHIAVLNSCPAALGWLAGRKGPAGRPRLLTRCGGEYPGRRKRRK